MHRTPTIVALAATGLVASVNSTATAEILTVCASGCQYTSINAAIDASSNGDVIQLAAETYYEGSVVDTDGKAITLRGAPTRTATGQHPRRWRIAQRPSMHQRGRRRLLLREPGDPERIGFG